MRKGLTVHVKDHVGGFEKAMRKFKKKVDNEGKLKKYREKEHHVTPSEQKQIDRKRAKSRHKKKLRDERKALDKMRNNRL